MKQRVELIYDADCPRIGEARTALLAAFAQRGLPAVWSEWNRRDPEAPAYTRSCGSPTVLVNGYDIDGPGASRTAECCRLYETEGAGLRGAPPVELIAAALGGSRPERRWPAFAAATPAALAAALPTCPLCWPLYAGALSAVGLGFLLNSEYVSFLAGALLLVTLWPLASSARVQGFYGPLLVGAAGSGAVLLGKFVWPFDVMLYGGLTALLAAFAWNIRLRDKKDCSRC